MRFRCLVRIATIALLPLSILSAPCRADESEITPGEEIVVFGTRLSTTGPQPVDEITADEVAARDSATVADLLRQVPGISAIAPGGAGGFTELFLRGADPNFTTVFVDGVRMNDPTDARGGAFDFSTIATHEVDNIEIVRGPFSALYGSGALAGAIYIDTRGRPPATPSGRAGFSAGSDEYWQAGGGASGPVGNGAGGFDVNYVDFGEPTPGSTRTVASASADFYAPLTDSLAADVTLRLSERERETYPVASGGPRLAVSDELETADADDLSIGVTLNLDSGKLSHSAQLTLLQRDELTVSPAIPDGVFSGVPATRSDAGLDRYSALLHSRFALSEVLEIAGGIEYQYEKGAVSGELDFGGFAIPTDFRATRSTTSPFLEGRVNATPALTLFAGLRYDHFSDDVDSALSPRVGAAYDLTDGGATVTVTWGEARKAPSFYALGDPLVGNPDLNPEDSEGFDVRVELPLRGDGLRLTLSGYRYTYSDLIDFDFATFQLVNRTEVDTDGAEAQLAGVLAENMSWSVYVAVLDNDVDGADNALLHRPERSAGGLLQWLPDDHWTITATGSYEDSRPSSSIPGGAETLDSYTRFNLAFGRALTDSLTLRLAVDNLFDTDYEAVAGFPAPGRQFRIGLQQVF